MKTADFPDHETNLKPAEFNYQAEFELSIFFSE